MPTGDQIDAVERIEREIQSMKELPEIELESTRRYVHPDPEDFESIYDTCDTLGPWDKLDDWERFIALNELDWDGVSPEDRKRIIAREAVGESVEDLRSLDAEIRDDEQAARVRDSGETGATIDRIQEAEPREGLMAADAIADGPEMERIVRDIEEQWLDPAGAVFDGPMQATAVPTRFDKPPDGGSYERTLRETSEAVGNRPANDNARDEGHDR